jgi:hypothetical protein
MKPSNFAFRCWNSIFEHMEYEVIAANIMTILKRTGDNWRQLSWEEYKEERLKDNNFTEGEKKYFDKVISYTVNADKARMFGNDWRNAA